MRYVVSGGSGFVGVHLIKLLLRDESATSIKVLSRSKNPQSIENLQKEQSFEKIEVVQWDPKNMTKNLVEAINGSDAIIHLAGTSIFQKRWSESFKQELIDSRVQSSNVLVEAIKECENKPSVFVSASGVSYYGSSGDDILAEDASSGDDFLAKLSIDWENAVKQASEFGVRTCYARIGIVLGEGGGALANMLPLFQWHIGGHVGNGMQWFPWVHIEDCARALIFACKNKSLEGPFNNVAPAVVRMNDFCRELGRSTNRWSWAHAPYFAVRLTLGEVANVIVCSLRVKPQTLENSGFEWNYTSLSEALDDILH